MEIALYSLGEVKNTESIIRIIIARRRTLSVCLDHGPFNLSSDAIYQSETWGRIKKISVESSWLI